MAGILLLEDDPVLGESLEALLQSRGYEVTWVTDGERAADAAFEGGFALYLFDINVPLLNGFDLLGALREADDRTPAIFLTALRDIASMTKGFAAGAEDYIKKPFDVDELLLRVEARMHRDTRRQLQYGDIVYDLQRGSVMKNGTEVDLGDIQKSIWHRLVTDVGRTVDKTELLEMLDHPSDQALRFHISKLNQKLGIKITNVRTVGYRLEAR